MNTLTIPKKLIREGTLVIIPRKEYEDLLKVRKWKNILDKDLQKSLAEYQKGKFFGPFDSVSRLKKSLER